MATNESPSPSITSPTSTRVHSLNHTEHVAMSPCSATNILTNPSLNANSIMDIAQGLIATIHNVRGDLWATHTHYAESME